MVYPQEECPEFCVQHDNGACVGEFDGPGEIAGGYHVYSRPRREPDGIPAVEVAIAQDGGPITRINVPVAAVPYQS